MPATIKDIAEYLGVSKPTVNNLVKKLDPNEEHITKRQRGAIVCDDFLTSAIADALIKKGTVDTASVQKMQDALAHEGTKAPRHEISGVKTLGVSKSQTDLKEAYERLLEAQKNELLAESNIKELTIKLEVSQADVERLTNEVADLKARNKELEDKLEAEKARYDALAEKAIAQPKVGFFRRLLGWGRDANQD